MYGLFFTNSFFYNSQLYNILGGSGIQGNILSGSQIQDNNDRKLIKKNNFY